MPSQAVNHKVLCTKQCRKCHALALKTSKPTETPDFSLPCPLTAPPIAPPVPSPLKAFVNDSRAPSARAGPTGQTAVEWCNCSTTLVAGSEVERVHIGRCIPAMGAANSWVAANKARTCCAEVCRRSLPHACSACTEQPDTDSFSPR